LQLQKALNFSVNAETFGKSFAKVCSSSSNDHVEDFHQLMRIYGGEQLNISPDSGFVLFLTPFGRRFKLKPVIKKRLKGSHFNDKHLKRKSRGFWFFQRRAADFDETLRRQSFWCGGGDLNPGTPTGRDPKSRAFGQARQPPRGNEFSSHL